MTMARLKGMVLEAGENWALILSEQGEYKKIKTKTLVQVGEIWHEPNGYMMKYAVAAAVLLMFLGAAFSFLPVVAYAQVSSGIELGLNRWEWVVTARPLNDDGRERLQELNLRGKSLDQAIELIVDNTLINNNSENKEIVLNVVTIKPGKEQDEQRIMEKIDAKVKQIMEKDKLKANKDNKKNGNSDVESKLPVDNKQTDKLLPANKDDLLRGNKPIDDNRTIKPQKMQDRNGKNNGIDEDLNAKREKENTEEQSRKINTGQNYKAIPGNNETKGEGNDKPEKMILKSFERLKNQPDKITIGNWSRSQEQ
jgi:hypothetical protein